MSFADTLIQTPLTVVPFSQLLTSMVQLIVLGAVLMFFRPLLIGLARALVLLVRPRPTKAELAARRKVEAAKRAIDTPDVHALGSGT